MGNSPTSIMTRSGRYFDIHDPLPEKVHLEDIGHALAREQRFANHTDAPYTVGGPLTVAAHSFRVARIGWHLWPDFVGAGLVLAADWATDGGHVIRDRIEFALALLLHDAAEAYYRDKPAPQKTDADREIENGVLSAILDHVADDTVQAERLRAWIDSPACELADRLARAQEALIFQHGAADWALPSESVAGLAVTRSLIVETLPQFWPRTSDHWCDAVRTLRAALRRLTDANAPARAIESAQAIGWVG